MPQNTREHTPHANRLLAALPKNEYQHLLSNLEQVPLTFGTTLHKPGEIIRHVYFPIGGIASLLATAGNGATLEVGMVGREGMIGVSAFMGVNTSRERAVVQGEGSAWRMKTALFRRACNDGGRLPQLLQRYTHSLLTQLSQVAVCNRFHPIDARRARWLLMTGDRMGANDFRMTQEFLSNMLGVRREGVNKAAGNLQRKKLIHYSRGALAILKRAGLEALACQCYRIIKDEYD